MTPQCFSTTTGDDAKSAALGCGGADAMAGSDPVTAGISGWITERSNKWFTYWTNEGIR